VSEVQVLGNVTMHSDVCLRYMVGKILLYVVLCVWGTERGKCYLYSDVFLIYRVREMLLCTVMCA